MNSLPTSTAPIENYFEYFSEIEARFQQRRGTTLLLSTLDWALIETWKDSGIPLAAALRGIDEAFDQHDRRASKSRKINGLAYCAQAVLTAAEEMKEAAIGAAASRPRSSELQAEEVQGFILKNAAALEQFAGAQQAPPAVRETAEGTARSLQQLAAGLAAPSLSAGTSMEDVERRLTVLEEKLFAALLASHPDEEILSIRAQAESEIAPYRRKMVAAQIEQLRRQYVHKRLLERYGLSRLSLFYMH